MLLSSTLEGTLYLTMIYLNNFKIHSIKHLHQYLWTYQQKQQFFEIHFAF